MSDWISVKDELPIANEDLIVHWSDGTVTPGQLVPYPFGLYLWQHPCGTDAGKVGWGGKVMPDAVHWMPLPPPPQPE